VDGILLGNPRADGQNAREPSRRKGNVMASGIICQSCGIEAPTRLVDFHQNIGVLVMRFRRRMNGMLCKRCVHKHFWKMTGTTLFLGPWGTISLVLAPCFIINNIVRYLSVIGMPAVPPDAKVPMLDEKALRQLQPLAPVLVQRLKNQEPLAAIATDLAQQAQVTPGQVIKYVAAMSTGNQMSLPQPPTRGFPVLPAKSPPPIPVSPLPVELIELIPVEAAESAKQAVNDGPADIGLTL